MLQIMVVTPHEEQLKDLTSLCESVFEEQIEFICRTDGAEALRYMENNAPDLLFSAVDLPDMDGVRLVSQQSMKSAETIFVLIAPRKDPGLHRLQRAVKRGVEHCLFYPFQPSELLYLLLSAAEKKRNCESVELQLAKRTRSLRNSFMDRFIESDSFAYEAIDIMNREYNVNFSNGIFQVAIINFNLPMEQERGMLDNIVEDVRLLLDSLCFEMVPFIRKNRSIVLVANYASSHNIRAQLKELLQIVLRNQARHNCGTSFSIGVGFPEWDSFYLKRAFRTAEYAMRCQLLSGPNQIFLYEETDLYEPSMDSPEIKNALNQLELKIEALDTANLEYCLYNVMSVLTNRIDPAFISALCSNIGTLVISTLNKTVVLPNSQEKMAQIHQYLNTQTSLAGLKSVMSRWAMELVSYCKNCKSGESTRAIFEARQYIERNYMKPLTLQSISEKVGLSRNYFCVLFQKEVGRPFVDYLTHLRIEQAKKLLLETSLSVAEISEQVGYSTPKYFSRIFMKRVEMQPSTYRALHKQGIKRETDPLDGGSHMS